MMSDTTKRLEIVDGCWLSGPGDVAARLGRGDLDGGGRRLKLDPPQVAFPLNRGHVGSEIRGREVVFAGAVPLFFGFGIDEALVVLRRQVEMRGAANDLGAVGADLLLAHFSARVTIEDAARFFSIAMRGRRVVTADDVSVLVAGQLR